MDPATRRPLDVPEIATIDHFNLQEKLDELDLSVDERNANEAAWVGHFNGMLLRCAYISALRWTSAAGGSWHLMHEASAIYRLADGTRSLAGAIAEDSEADIRCGCRVESIAHDDEGAQVRCEDGRVIDARRVVITLPQNLLHQLSVTPGLPQDKLAPSIEKTASRGAKAWIRVRGPIKPFFAYSSQHHPLSVVRTEFIGEDDAVLVAFGALGRLHRRRHRKRPPGGASGRCKPVTERQSGSASSAAMRRVEMTDKPATSASDLNRLGWTTFAPPDRMTAVVLTRHGGPEVLQVREDFPTPAVADHEVLVAVAAAGMNNTDVWSREGSYGTAGAPNAWAVGAVCRFVSHG